MDQTDRSASHVVSSNINRFSSPHPGQDECGFILALVLMVPSQLSCLFVSVFLGGYVPAPLTPQQGNERLHPHTSPCTCFERVKSNNLIQSYKCTLHPDFPFSKFSLCSLAEDGNMSDYLDESGKLWSVGSACQCRWLLNTC